MIVTIDLADPKFSTLNGAVKLPKPFGATQAVDILGPERGAGLGVGVKVSVRVGRMVTDGCGVDVGCKVMVGLDVDLGVRLISGVDVKTVKVTVGRIGSVLTEIVCVGRINSDLLFTQRKPKLARQMTSPISPASPQSNAGFRFLDVDSLAVFPETFFALVDRSKRASCFFAASLSGSMRKTC